MVPPTAGSGRVIGVDRLQLLTARIGTMGTLDIGVMTRMRRQPLWLRRTFTSGSIVPAVDLPTLEAASIGESRQSIESSPPDDQTCARTHCDHLIASHRRRLVFRGPCRLCGCKRFVRA